MAVRPCSVHPKADTHDPDGSREQVSVNDEMEGG